MADAAARRLGWLLLGYLAGIVASIVLAPFQLDIGLLARASWQPLGGTEPRDVLLNVVLFLPLGFLLERVRGGRMAVWRVALAAAGASLLVECTQLMIPGRFSAPSDVLANSAGAAFGAVASREVRRRVGVAGQLVGRLFLDLPLVGLCWLLVPLAWLVGLAGAAPGRALLVIPLAMAVGVALAAAGRSGPASHRWPLLAPVAAGWGGIALSPVLAVAPFVGGAAVAGLVTCFTIGDRWWGRSTRTERRVEPGAILIVLVLLVPWLVTTDPTMGSLAWTRGAAATRAEALAILEVLAGCTVLGYAMAESRGRAERRGLAAILPPVTVITALGAGLHWPVTPARLGVMAIGAVLGSLLYLRQRDAVVSLRSGGDPG